MSGFSDPVGFAGLADLVSDVATDVDAAERAVRAPPSPPVPRTAAPSPRHTAKSASGGLAALLAAIPAKLWVFGGVAALAWMCNAASSKPSRYTASTSSSTYSSPASSSGNSGYGVPSSASSSYGTLDYTETKPPVGSGRSLSMSELRYCVFEDERIGYMKPLVTDNGRVDTFNRYVQDYNSRCSSFHYRRGTLEAVRREASDRASSLQSEARLRFY
jgi:hypothetical protein